jgi:hypothetical protein
LNLDAEREVRACQRDSDVFPTDPGDFLADSDDFVTSFDHFLTSFDGCLTSFDRFLTSFEIFPTSIDRTLTSFEIFPTHFDRCLTSFDLFPTYFDRFVTGFDHFPTYFDRCLTSFDLFLTSFGDFLKCTTDSDTCAKRVTRSSIQQPHPSNQLSHTPHQDTQFQKLGRHQQQPGRQTSSCELQSPQSATRPSKFHPHGPHLGPRIATPQPQEVNHPTRCPVPFTRSSLERDHSRRAWSSRGRRLDPDFDLVTTKRDEPFSPLAGEKGPVSASFPLTG